MGYSPSEAASVLRLIQFHLKMQDSRVYIANNPSTPCLTLSDINPWLAEMSESLLICM